MIDAVDPANLPGAQSMHEIEPVTAAYVPTSQAALTVPPPSHLYPASQNVVTPLGLTYDPGGTAVQPVFPSPTFPDPAPFTAIQLLQLVCPGSFWNVPSTHAMQSALPPAPDFPAGQITCVVGPDW